MTVTYEWDMADRLRKSLRGSSVGVGEMAERLGVSRNTISNWVNGRVTPDQRSLMLWSSVTRYPVEWLETGSEGGKGSPLLAWVDGEGKVVEWAPSDSNRQPAVYVHSALTCADLVLAA